MLECVVNVSEGRDRRVIADLSAACGEALLDTHTDADHNRTVFTLAGDDAARSLARAAVAAIDLRSHTGAHPRIGAVDVVPFVALSPTPEIEALRARNAFARWAGSELELPCFLYGPVTQGDTSHVETERTLPEVRRGAFDALRPDEGPPEPHPSAGACAVGARRPLVAYNVWLAGTDREAAARIAEELRSPAVRALGLDVGGQAQVSMNLIAPEAVGPAEVYDRIAARAEVERAELVGLIPRAALEAVSPRRWEELDLSADRTIEARAERAGL